MRILTRQFGVVCAVLHTVAFVTSAQTFTCVGCSDYGPIKDTGYTMQYGAKMVWTASVEPGTYIVSLTFVEPVYATTGQRPINVWVNDAQLLGALDILASVKPFTPITWRTPTMDSAGKIIVVLTANDTGPISKPVKHSAIVSAISAVKLSAGAGASPPIKRYVNVKMVQQSDKTYVTAGGLVGKVIVSTLQVTRNGLIQEDSLDYSFDSSNNSVRLLWPASDDDKIAITVDTQQ